MKNIKLSRSHTLMGICLVSASFFLAHSVASLVSPSSPPIFKPFEDVAVDASVTIYAGDNHMGSGVVVNRNGLIVTNAHVVGQSKVIQIRKSRGKVIAGTVVKVDALKDLALIRTQETFRSALPLAVSVSAPGDIVIAVGSPYGVCDVTTKGVVVNNVAKNHKPSYTLQSRIAVHPGNSGGALVNDRGELVGITSGFLDGFPDQGLAIPVGTVKIFIADQLDNN